MARIPLVDALKGVTILLVVLGHSIQANMDNFDENWLYRLIYAFHMPLFMFLSGYVTRISFSANYIAGKFNRLVVPFVCWYVVAFLWLPQESGMSFFSYIVRLIHAPDYGLWFLWVLFLCHLSLWTSFKVSYRRGSYLIVSAIIVALLPLTKTLGLHFLKWYYIFFLAGFIFAKQVAVFAKIRKKMEVAVIIAFPISVAFWHRTKLPIFSKWLPSSFFDGTIPYMGTLVQYTYKLLVAILGIGFVYAVISRICRNKTICAVLGWFGLFSLEIYVVHQSLLFLSIGAGMVKVVSTAIIATCISLMIAFVLKKNPLLNFCFYGGRKARD